MTKVTETKYQYDLSGKLASTTATEIVDYDEDDLLEGDADIIYALDDGDECDEDDDDSIVYDGEFTVDLIDLATKALGMLTVGITAIASIKLLNKVSK